MIQGETYSALSKYLKIKTNHLTEPIFLLVQASKPKANRETKPPIKKLKKHLYVQ